MDNYGQVWSWGDNAYWEDNGEGKITPIWDDKNRTAQTGKLGRTSEYTYDVTRVDPDGNITTTTVTDRWLDPYPGQVMMEGDIPLGTGQVEITVGKFVDDPIVSVAAGKDFSLALSRSGRVYAWGRDDCGQLGQSGTDLTWSPVAIQVDKGNSPSSIGSKLSDVIAIAAGGDTAYALQANGTLWAWGDNRYGQLGADSPVERRTTPVRVMKDRIVSVAAGDSHAVAVAADAVENGSVWGFGRADSNQIGDLNGAEMSRLPVLMVERGVTWEDIMRELSQR